MRANNFHNRTSGRRPKPAAKSRAPNWQNKFRVRRDSGTIVKSREADLPGRGTNPQGFSELQFSAEIPCIQLNR
jgi:hypothetical protein